MPKKIFFDPNDGAPADMTCRPTHQLKIWKPKKRRKERVIKAWAVVNKKCDFKSTVYIGLIFFTEQGAANHLEEKERKFMKVVPVEIRIRRKG